LTFVAPQYFLENQTKCVSAPAAERGFTQAIDTVERIHGMKRQKTSVGCGSLPKKRTRIMKVNKHSHTNRKKNVGFTANYWTCIIDVSKLDVSEDEMKKIIRLRSKHKKLSDELNAFIGESHKPVDGVITIEREVVDASRKIFARMDNVRNQISEIVNGRINH
jgi:hypothetical protein